MLGKKHCVPCEGKISPLGMGEIEEYMKQVTGWELLEAPRGGNTTREIMKIRKVFTFKDFMAAMDFVNRVASIAEEEGHHPDIYIYYNKVVLELYTHAVGGLFINDFIIASKVDQLLEA